MEQKPNPHNQLESVIKDSKLPELATEYSEILIDAILDEGVLKDMPLVGSVIGIVKFTNSIDQHFMTKKLYKFLFQLHKIPSEKRIKKIEEINSSQKYSCSVGEKILELLDKIDSEGKPEILGKLFKAVIQEKIDYLTYLRLAHTVKNIFYYDLIWLSENNDGQLVNEGVNDPLLTSGLVGINIVDDYLDAKKEIIGSKSLSQLTELGKILLEFGMK